MCGSCLPEELPMNNVPGPIWTAMRSSMRILASSGVMTYGRIAVLGARNAPKRLATNATSRAEPDEPSLTSLDNGRKGAIIGGVRRRPRSGAPAHRRFGANAVLDCLWSVHNPD